MIVKFDQDDVEFVRAWSQSCKAKKIQDKKRFIRLCLFIVVSLFIISLLIRFCVFGRMQKVSLKTRADNPRKHCLQIKSSMCIIIIKQKGKKVPQEVAKTSAKINPHGLGIIWLDTFEVSYHKSAEFKVLESQRPYIAHFRYATVGAINKENTHPFRCGKNQNEWLMMNGTIQGLGNAQMSDSRVSCK